MNPMHRLLLLVVTVGMTTSCAHIPTNTRRGPADESIRAQYLQDYPNGVYNDHIMRGELATGMNVIEVLASWGLPDEREWDQASNRVSWFYTSRDEHSRDYVAYELVFEDLVLARWILERGIAGAGGVFARDAAGLWGGDADESPSLDAFRNSKSATKR